jgi:CheY-like chemotaxis protein
MTKVLVIDDEAALRLLCRVNLEATGIEVLEATDGPSGLDKARAERPDVIVLDMMMPGMTGVEVAEELLAGESTKDVPIIFLSARAELRDRERGQDSGGIVYLSKPFNPLELGPLVERLAHTTGDGEWEELRQRRVAELKARLLGEPPRRLPRAESG